MACAVVSGAASGIGRACAAALRADGLAVASIDLAAAADVDLALEADVADAEAVEAAVARAEAELGPVEVVVTAAGYYERAAVGATGVAAWRRMLAVQLGGTVNLARSAYTQMLARSADAPRGGREAARDADAPRGGPRPPATRTLRAAAERPPAARSARSAPSSRSAVTPTRPTTRPPRARSTRSPRASRSRRRRTACGSTASPPGRPTRR